MHLISFGAAWTGGWGCGTQPIIIIGVIRGPSGLLWIEFSLDKVAFGRLTSVLFKARIFYLETLSSSELFHPETSFVSQIWKVRSHRYLEYLNDCFFTFGTWGGGQRSTVSEVKRPKSEFSYVSSAQYAGINNHFLKKL